MKKDTFIKGALISTICVVLSKILGIIYVIPFNKIIGSEGGALYGYAYNIYVLFLQLSTVGIPLAISKLVSEYNALNYHDAKKRVYKVALIITSIISIIVTIILNVFAYDIAYMIKGNVVGGNTLSDIAFVIRVSSSAIFFVTLLSNMRGFLQGQKYITHSSISQVIEQFVRIIVIVLGSYIFIKLFGVKEAVAVAIFGATVGAIAAIIYLFIKGKKELKLKDNDYKIKEEEREITNSYLTKKLIKCTIPFVMLSIIVSLYNSIDMFTVIKTLVNKASFAVEDAEYIMSCISTWGAKLNMIVTSISAGIATSLLPNITDDYTKGNYKAISDKVIKTVSILLVLVIPMVLGLSFLASPVWTVFYGNNSLGIKVFTYSIFTALLSGLFTNINVIMQSVNSYRKAYFSLIVGIMFKIIMNVPFILLFNNLGLPAYYGNITVTILSYLISIILNLITLKKEFKIDFKIILKILLLSVLSGLIMYACLYGLSYLIPITNLSKLKCIMVIIIYSVVGGIIYLSLMLNSKTIKNNFHDEIKIIKQKKFSKFK